MSGSNPLQTQAPPPQQPPQQGPDPMVAHAQIWQHVNQLHPDDVAQGAERAAYALHILGKLAANPKVSRKDVIKAIAQATADGKIDAAEGIKTLTQMPNNPDDLQGWLRDRYVMSMTALVHMKAAMMKGGQQ